MARAACSIRAPSTICSRDCSAPVEGGVGELPSPFDDEVPGEEAVEFLHHQLVLGRALEGKPEPFVEDLVPDHHALVQIVAAFADEGDLAVEILEQAQDLAAIGVEL